MRITVFGASGRTGRHVIDHGLSRGHELTAFVRDAARFTVSDDRLEIVEGDARDPASVEAAVAGRDGVISVLALARAEDEPQYSDATRVIVEAMRSSGVLRIVVTANNDVFGDREVTGEFAAHAREHRRNRENLRASGLDWTIGAARSVVDKPATGAYRFELDAKAPGRKITTADYATFALDALDQQQWIGHIVGASN